VLTNEECQHDAEGDWRATGTNIVLSPGVITKVRLLLLLRPKRWSSSLGIRLWVLKSNANLDNSASLVGMLEQAMCKVHIEKSLGDRMGQVDADIQ
jgi:hypothetical protein